MKKEIPTQKENPKGLHQRFWLRKIIPASPEYKEHMRMIHETTVPPNLNFLDLSKKEEYTDPEFMLAEINKDAEYFVLRLDEGGSDIEHIKACRIGINAYADAIKNHLPELSNDLKTRYPLL